jgi:hypothetical protein
MGITKQKDFNPKKILKKGLLVCGYEGTKEEGDDNIVEVEKERRGFQYIF